MVQQALLKGHTHTHTHTHTHMHTHVRAHTRARRHRRHGGLSPSSLLLLHGPWPSPLSGGFFFCSDGSDRALPPSALSLLLHGPRTNQLVSYSSSSLSWQKRRWTPHQTMTITVSETPNNSWFLVSRGHDDHGGMGESCPSSSCQLPAKGTVAHRPTRRWHPPTAAAASNGILAIN